MSGEKIDVDREFSKLESLAFSGEWDPAEKSRLWKALELDSMWEKGIATNPEHDRLQHIITVYWVLSSNKDPKVDLPIDFETIQRYAERYPSCVAQMPSKLYNALFPAEGQSEDKR